MMVAIIIVCIIIAVFDINWWKSCWLDIVSISIACADGIFLFIVLVVLLCTWCAAPHAQAKYEQRYAKIMHKVAHIDSYNREDVMEEVDAWNEEYLTNVYGKKSPLVGCFYNLNLDTTSYINMKGE